ncbi:MAG: diguanylate cyclase [Nitrospirota bacterium]|nr:diguanylate cyclase [Nitrospirota bacterium]
MLDQPLVSDIFPTLETAPFSSRLRLPVHTARELVVTTAWVSENAPAEKVYRMFGQDPRLPGLAILRDQCPVGLIFRSTLIERFSFRYSHELFGPKPITSFMDPRPVSLDVSTDIDEVGRRLEKDFLPRTMEDGFLVVDKGRFVGIGTWQMLMKCLSERREELFSYMAHHDPLTGLPNRIRFMETIEAELEKGGKGAMFYIDLDRFKAVNDRYGHQEGDRLLNEFADRLLLSSGPGELVARLGGDEFGVLLPGADDPRGASQWIAQFMSSLEKPCLIAGHPYRISASVGYCLYPESGRNLSTIFNEADTQMYRVKRQRNGERSMRSNKEEKDSGIGDPDELSLGVAVMDDEGRPLARNRRWDPGSSTRTALAFSIPASLTEKGDLALKVSISGKIPLGDGADSGPPEMSQDKLTGLLDRTSFYSCLSKAVAEQSQKSGTCLLLLVMDLDRFQATNDISGHTVGDRVLKAVSERLMTVVRQNDLVARLGGDEFALVFSGVTTRSAAEKLAEEILQAVSLPYQIDGQEYFLTTSIGATIMPEDARDFETLISNADLALSQSKDRGRYQVQFFSAVDRAQQTARYSMEKRLYKALERKEFRLHFQPIIDMETHRTVGAEALIRWMGGDGTVVPPDQFIPIAEENGMIVPVGEWVIRAALEELSIWKASGLGGLRVAINLSARQLQEPGFLAHFLEILDRSGEDPGQVTIELTETVLMRKAQESIELLGAMKARNICIAIDDFGTGYSSLGYLRRFPVDLLKIDRSFVRQIDSGGEDAEIVRLIAVLARTLNLGVCAEGVETKEQRVFLRDLGVGTYQGYVASPALPSGAFIEWVKNKKSRSSSEGPG